MNVQKFYSILMVFLIGISVASSSALHGPCVTDEDCGTIDTVCHNGVCSCREDFTVWYDSCVPLPNPRIPCTKKNECRHVLGIKSMCTKRNECACKAFHHLHLGQCVKNRDLHDTCDHDHQCYCGSDCQDKIACIYKNCTCKVGHRPYRSRRCISEDPSVFQIAQQQIQLPIGLNTTETFESNNITKSVSNRVYGFSLMFCLLLVKLINVLNWTLVDGSF